MPPVSVRPATPADAAAVARVHCEAWRSAYRGLLPDAFLDSMEPDARRIARWAASLSLPADDPRFTIVAEAPGDGVIGFTGGGPCRDAEPAASAEMFTLYLLDRWRGRGAGRLLFEAFADAVVRRGHRSLVAWVLEGNAPARRFYEARGGRPAGARSVDLAGAPRPCVAYVFDPAPPRGDSAPRGGGGA
jgi:L-amino acid N-acyltransferase YncA